ncbi:MAG: hypothetical protein V2A71_00705 [Candidatus Eisenbacteria bacterium]
MWKTTEGSTGRLLQLCVSYFIFYVITGLTVKYFTGKADLGFPGMGQIEYLVYSTLGGTSLCVTVVLVLRWFKSKSTQLVRWGSLTFPREFLYIIPSGVCTAVVIPTTTLMYSLPISVMVAMVIMRASVIVISRVVDEVQIRQGILHKTVYKEENIGVVFALLAASVQIFWVEKGSFDFAHSTAAMSILGSYIVAYSIRIYIMNYYKNTRGKGVKLDNKWFFSIEQIAACITLVVVSALLFYSPRWFGWNVTQLELYRAAIVSPQPMWAWGVLAGTAFGMVAFFSVFIFMFKGRTATFAGLVNRLTSLVAGTTATLVFWLVFGGRFPRTADWVSLALILVAVGFLTIAERKRVAELVAAHEIEIANSKAAHK